MARYPGAEREQRIDAGTLLRQVTAIFAACGMSDDDAALLVDSLGRASPLIRLPARSDTV